MRPVFNLHTMVLPLQYFYVSPINCPSTPPYQKNHGPPFLRIFVYLHPLLYKPSQFVIWYVLQNYSQEIHDPIASYASTSLIVSFY